jgi:hypothetical protein
MVTINLFKNVFTNLFWKVDQELSIYVLISVEKSVPVVAGDGIGSIVKPWFTFIDSNICKTFENANDNGFFNF